MEEVVGGYRKVFSRVRPDLKDLRKKSVFWIVPTIGSIMTFLSIFNLNEGEWAWDSHQEGWRQIFLYLNGVTSFTGSLFMILLIHRKISTYFWGQLHNLTYIPFSIAYGYVGDAQITILFFLIQWKGVIEWKDEMDDTASVTLVDMGWKRHALSIGVSALFTLFFYYEIPVISEWWFGEYTMSTVPRILDSATNGMSIVAQFLTFTRNKGMWTYWSGINLAKIAMYSGVTNLGVDANMIILWGIFLFYSSYGHFTWKKTSASNKDDCPC